MNIRLIDLKHCSSSLNVKSAVFFSRTLTMSSSNYHFRTVDVFQASLLNLINDATDTGITNLFQSKTNELHRFILIQYIHSFRH